MFSAWLPVRSIKSVTCTDDVEAIVFGAAVSSKIVDSTSDVAKFRIHSNQFYEAA